MGSEEPKDKGLAVAAALAKHNQRVMEIATSPRTFEYFIDHLGRTVKRDKPLRNLLVLTGLSAYTKNPINLFLKGPSSVGKSYNVTEALKYFSEDDAWMLGGLSPTALVHDHGTLVDEHNNPIDLSFYDQIEDKKERRIKIREALKGSRYLIDLRYRILVFLESPHPETFRRLYPVLSHDRWEIMFKITDKLGGRLQTKTVILRGWPAAVFCTTKADYVEEMSTRCFTYTPEISKEKFGEAIDLQGEMSAFPWEFEVDEELEYLRSVINIIIDQIVNLNLRISIPYGREMAGVYPRKHQRDMRDFGRFKALVELHAYFNVLNRPILTLNEKCYLLPIQTDYDAARWILEQIIEETRSGLPTNIIEFYEKILKKQVLTYDEIVQHYHEVTGGSLSSFTIRQHYIQPLVEVGWVNRTKSDDDRRKTIIEDIKSQEIECKNKTPFFNELFNVKSLGEWEKRLKKYSAKNRDLHIEVLKENRRLDKTQFINMVFSHSNFKGKIKTENPQNIEKPLEKTEHDKSTIFPKLLRCEKCGCKFGSESDLESHREVCRGG